MQRADVVVVATAGSGWVASGAADKAAAREALEHVGMAPLEGRQISQLSGGQQQRVFLARALVQDAELYFMDEPFQGVDAATELAIVELLRELRSQGRRSSPSITTCRRCPSTSTRWRSSTCAGSRRPGRGGVHRGEPAPHLRRTGLLRAERCLTSSTTTRCAPSRSRSAALGLTSGALGTFAVLRRQSLLGDAISHAALPGVALAFLLTSSKAPLVLVAGAALAGFLGTLVVMGVSARPGSSTTRRSGSCSPSSSASGSCC